MKLFHASFLILTLGHSALGQFAPSFLQNASYWGDGKSEVDLYAADFVRSGQHYNAELLMVFSAEFVDPKLLTRANDSKQPGVLPVIRMHQSVSLTRGLLLEQRSLMALWRMDFMSLARLRFTGSDGTEPANRVVTEIRDGGTIGWKYSLDSYRKVMEKPTVPSPSGTVVFLDELPLRVRTLDFSKPTGTFEIELGGSIVHPEDEEIVFKSATISYKVTDRVINVDLKQGGATDHFVVDADFPFLLREWKAADGSSLKLKNSLKADFAKYDKPGDRERALKDPMLRHPD